MFKSGLVYSVLGSSELDFDQLEAALAERAAIDIRKDHGRSLGWCPPYKGGDNYVIESQGQRLMQVMEQVRVLPKDVIREIVDERVDALAQREGRPVTKAERAPIEEEVTLELLKVSHVRRVKVLVWWDVRRQRLFVNASSPKKVEDVLDLLRQTIGSLKVVPLTTATLPDKGLTHWLNSPDQAPEWLQVGSGCTLKEKGEGGSFTAKKVDILNDDHAQKLIEGGLTVKELEIGMNETLTCKVNENLQFKSIKFADEVRELQNDNGDTHGEDLYARFEGDFIIMADAMGRFISGLVESLGGLGKAKSADEKIAAANKDSDSSTTPA